MKKRTTWQDYYQVKYLLLNYYPEDYSVNAILILPPGCPILAPDSADDLSGTSPKTTGFSVWDLQGDTTSTRELGFQGDVSQTFTIGKLSKH